MTITEAQQTAVFHRVNDCIFETDLYNFVSIFANPTVTQQQESKKKYFVHYDSIIMLHCFSIRSEKGFTTSFYFDSKRKAEEYLFSHLYNLLPCFYSEGKDYFLNHEIAEMDILSVS